MKLLVIDGVIESGEIEGRIQQMKEEGWEVFVIPGDKKIEERLLVHVEVATRKVAVLRHGHPRTQAFKGLGCTVVHVFDVRAMVRALNCLLPAAVVESAS